MIAIVEPLGKRPRLVFGVTRADYDRGWLRLWCGHLLVVSDYVVDWMMA